MARRMQARGTTECIALNGSNQGFTIPYVVSGGPLTVCFWALIRRFSNYDRIIDTQDSGPANGFDIEARDNGQLYCTIKEGSTTRALLTKDDTIKGVWMHVALAYEENNAGLYVDGIEEATDDTVVMASSEAVFSVGKRSGGSNYSNVLVKGLHVYETRLSQLQIQDDMYMGSCSASPVVKLDLSENLIDTSGNGYDGTAVGTPSYVTYFPYGSRS